MPFKTPDNIYNHINKVVFSPDERLLAVITSTMRGGGRDDSEYVLPITPPSPKAQLWNIETGKLQQTFTRSRPTEPNFSDIEFSPNGESIALAFYTSPVELWGTRTGKLLRVLPESGYAKDIFYSPDGRLLVGGRQGSAWHIWNAQTGKHLRVLQNGPAGNELIGFANNSTLYGLYIGPDSQRDPQAAFWDVKTGKVKQTLLRLQGYIYKLKSFASFSPQGKFIAFIDPDNGVVQLRRNDKDRQPNPINLMRVPAPSAVSDFYFSPDNRVLVVCVAHVVGGSSSGVARRDAMYFFDVNSGRLIVPEQVSPDAYLSSLLDEYRPLGFSSRTPSGSSLLATTTGNFITVVMWRMEY